LDRRFAEVSEDVKKSDRHLSAMNLALSILLPPRERARGKSLRKWDLWASDIVTAARALSLKWYATSRSRGRVEGFIGEPKSLPLSRVETAQINAPAPTNKSLPQK